MYFLRAVDAWNKKEEERRRWRNWPILNFLKKHPKPIPLLIILIGQTLKQYRKVLKV